MFYTDNPILDAERYYAEREEEVERLPECSECGQPIQDEHCYEINDEYICEKCLVENHKKYTDDYVGQGR